MDYPTLEETPPAAESSNVKSLLREILETLLLTAAIYLLVNFTVGRFRIDGDSMEPSMHNGQYVLVSKLSYRFGEPRRGDVIVFRFPNNPDRDFIKRIIGLPGDRVEIVDGTVRVNGVEIAEPYISAAPTYEGDWVVEASKFFVLGDNRNYSSDSHAWGLLDRSAIIGKAWFVYWPPKSWGPVPHYVYAVP